MMQIPVSNVRPLSPPSALAVYRDVWEAASAAPAAISKAALSSMETLPASL
jgi:hypothetical protein